LDNVIGMRLVKDMNDDEIIKWEYLTK